MYKRQVGTAIYAGPVKKAAEFQEQMSGVKAISGATTEEIAQLSNKAKEMGADVYKRQALTLSQR